MDKEVKDWFDWIQSIRGYLWEQFTDGIPIIMRETLAQLIVKRIRELGYCNLSGKPLLLSDNEILDIYHKLPNRDTDLEMAMEGGRRIAQAQLKKILNGGR